MSLLQRHVELFEFARGPKVLRVTSGDRAVIWSGQTYVPIPGLKRGRLGQSESSSRNDLDITAPASFSLSQWFASGVPTEPIYVTLRRVRVSDGAAVTLWAGVLGGLRETISSMQLRGQSLSAALGALGPRRAWQVACPYALYSVECGVNREDFRVAATLTAGNGYVVSAAAFAGFADGYFDGGYVRWNVGANIEHRWIVKHIGTDLMLLTPASAGVGASVDALPGCDHSIATCDAKFSNAANYGGQHSLPKQDPFDGRATF